MSATNATAHHVYSIRVQPVWINTLNNMKFFRQLSPRKRSRARLRGSLHFGFDRAELFLDIVDLPPYIREKMPTGFKLQSRGMVYSPVWQSHLELRQPSPEELQWLADSLSGICNYTITKVEVAADYTPPSGLKALDVQREVVRSVRVKSERSPAHLEPKYKTIVYFGPGGRIKGTALYSDRRSKLYQNREGSRTKCVHIEQRLRGKAALEAAGVTTLSDLVSFDHEAHLRKTLVVVARTSDAELGRLFTPAAARIDPTRAGQRWSRQFHIGGGLSIHNARLNPKYRKRVDTLPLLVDLRALYHAIESSWKRRRKGPSERRPY